MSKAVARLLTVCLFVCSVTARSLPPMDGSLMGFYGEDANTERALESKFDAGLKAENLRSWLQRLSARPHHVGSAYDKDNAEFMLSLYKSWGYDAQIEQFRPWPLIAGSPLAPAAAAG